MVSQVTNALVDSSSLDSANALINASANAMTLPAVQPISNVLINVSLLAILPAVHFTITSTTSDTPLTLITVPCSMDAMILPSCDSDTILAKLDPLVLEMVLLNGVTIHGSADSESVILLMQVVEEFPVLWEDSGKHIKLPIDEWM